MPRLLAAILMTAVAAHAQTTFPPASWQDAPDPIASPFAIPGGQLVSYAGQYPPSFNYYLAHNVFSSELSGMMFETLLDLDPETLAYTPGLASQWVISEDKQTFTFTLNTNAFWSDGTPITAADVAWTYQTIMDPANLTGPHKVSLERFSPPEIMDERTIAFTANQVHWQNLGAVGGMLILPKHAFENQDFNKINFEFPVVSGPYRLGTINEGVSIEMIRRQDWWRQNQQRVQNTLNFERLVYRFYAERENAFEAFEQGMVDIYPVHTARLWINETRGNRYLNNWILKQSIRNHQPVGFQGFAMNMRRPPFDDVKVRKAMAHLLNRPRMNATLMYNQYFLHRSYYEDLYDKDNPCENPIVDYNPTKARALLAEAGWQANPETGKLEKDGTVFTFSFLTRDPTANKFLQIYNEDLEAVGITMTIDRKDWAAWSKAMTQFEYDMTWAAWSAGIFKNPESMWHSSEADRTGGNNITGFKNDEVDQLIEQQKSMFDAQARHALVRRIDAILAREYPYILLWNTDAVRLLYWNKFGTPPTVLSRHGDASSARGYWWYDPDLAAELESAMDNSQPLPPAPAEVVFDDALETAPLF